MEDPPDTSWVRFEPIMGVRVHRWRAWLRTVALRFVTWVAGRIEGER